MDSFLLTLNIIVAIKTWMRTIVGSLPSTLKKRTFTTEFLCANEALINRCAGVPD